MKGNKLIRIIDRSILTIIAFLSLALTIFGVLRVCGFTTAGDLINLRVTLGDSFWFWLVIGLLQILQVIFIPVSNQIITVPLALAFPVNEVWKVWICSWISIWLATIILYIIGKKGGSKLLTWILSDAEQVEKCNNFLRKGWIFYPIGMLLPLPDDIITVLAGTAKMNFWFIVSCSFITRGIDTVCSVYGLGVLTKYWWGWPLLIVGVIILGILTFVGIKWSNTVKEK